MMKNPFKTITHLKSTVVEFERKLENQSRLLEAVQVQMSNTATEIKGNSYQDYSEAVDEVVKKYNCLAEFGCSLTGIIVDLRAVFVIGQGIQVKSKIPDEENPSLESLKSIAWNNEFYKLNGLDKDKPLRWAEEAEKEAKILISAKLFDENHEWTWIDDKGNTVKEKGMVKARFLPYSTLKYSVSANKDDYELYEKVTYKDDNDKDVILKQNEFVYGKYGGNINDPDSAGMRIWRCLDSVENLDRALTDLRGSNHLFATPKPSIKYETADEVRSFVDLNADMNFKGRNMIAHTGEFSFVSPSMDGCDSLIKEIVVNAKIISADTCIAVHFLGLPDLMSNRSTSDSLTELMDAGTVKERGVMLRVYQELTRKAMAMQNEKAGGKTFVNDKDIEISINSVTREQWERIVKVYLPMAKEGKMSDETLVSLVPGIDPKLEMERLKEQSDSEFDKYNNINDDKLNLEGGTEDGKEKE